MDQKASEIIGEEILASVRLECPELIRDMMSGSVSDYDDYSAGSSAKQGIQGAAGSLFGRLTTGTSGKSSLGQGGVYYVAAGHTRLVFFSINRGFVKSSLGKLLAEYSRESISALEIKKGLMPKAHFIFKDGTSMDLMCARALHGKLKKLQQVLNT